MVQLLEQDQASFSSPPMNVANEKSPGLTPSAVPDRHGRVDAKYEADVRNVARLEDDLQFLLFWVNPNVSDRRSASQKEESSRCRS